MTIARETGRAEIRICSSCGLPVLHKESESIPGPSSWWMAETHTAPCGLRCMGGGAKGRDGLLAFKQHQMHGAKNYACPNCGARRT